MKKKLKLLAIVGKNNQILQCTKTGRPLMGEPDHKEKLKKLIKLICDQDEEFKSCRPRIVKLKQTWW